MKNSYEHLPENKQEQLKWATDIIVDTVKPDMLILFGSYARGDWVEELREDGNYQYQSDFDLLAIVKNESLAKKIERKTSLMNRLGKQIRTPISLIAEDIYFVNNKLSKGQYFFTDILREGIMLHDSGKLELAEPGVLHINEIIQLATEDFDYWFNGASEYFRQYNHAIDDKSHNVAAFNLHQVAEKLIATMLLVFTRYKPKTHDLAKLLRITASVIPEILQIFPQGTQKEKDMFALLRKAYVDSRYKKDYVITAEELDWLCSRVLKLQGMVKQMCQEKISSLK
ncbi:MAG: HEPN domain-containing protein [Gammaproteobacteria bacterium]|nr:MAG: HEPN domain-containing protein [Gammaproteobacteria bacterium]